MKPKEWLMGMDLLTEDDMDLISKALAYCAANAGAGEFAKRARELYHRWEYPREISSLEQQARGEEFVMPGDVGAFEPGEVLTIKSQDVFIKPEPRRVSCAICDVEFLLDPFGPVNEGTNIAFILGPLKSETYYLCAKCWLWIPKVAVKALRRIHAEPLSLSGGTGGELWGGETPIPSSDSWECKPGGDLSISP